MTKNPPTILSQGLEPRIGDLSNALGESLPRVYLFTSIADVEDALMNWMGDNLPEGESLALLKVTLPETMVHRDPSVGCEVTVDQTIPPNAIKVLSKDVDGELDDLLG